MTPPRAVRWVVVGASAVLLVAGGTVVGVAAGFHHGSAVGLLVALVGSVTWFVLAGLLTRRRLGVAAAGAGWFVITYAFATHRAEGDLIIPGTATGYLYLLAGAVALGLALATPWAASATERGAIRHAVTWRPPSPAD